MSSIKEILHKIKHFYTLVPLEFLVGVIVLLVGFSSFGLGRLSALGEQREHIKLTYDTNLNPRPIYDNRGEVVVSKNGKRYHYPWCSGALKMSDTNKRWYTSIKQARAAGYTPAGNCNGLE